MIDTPGIWKVPAEGGEETQVLGQGGESSWVLAEGGFFDLKNPDGPTLNLYSLSTRKATLLRQFPKATKVAGGGNVLSVSPDGRWILYTQAEQSGSDLKLVETSGDAQPRSAIVARNVLLGITVAKSLAQVQRKWAMAEGGHLHDEAHRPPKKMSGFGP